MVFHPVSVYRATLWGVIFAAAVFIFDLLHPLGVAGAMPYVALPLLGLLARSRRLVITMGAIGTILTGAGVILSTAGAPVYVVFLNRAMTLILIWAVTIIAVSHLATGDRLRKSLEEQASHDVLTGLFNRRYVFGLLETELKRYQRYGEPFSLILIDADNFKGVNDTHGHCAGDVALRKIAEVCKKSVRDADVVGRFGGEEFIILLPHTQASDAAVVAERIRQTMHDSLVKWQDNAIDITLSLGVAEVGPDAESFDSILKAADDALYSAKHAGRDRVAIAPVKAPLAKKIKVA